MTIINGTTVNLRSKAEKKPYNIPSSKVNIG